MERQGYLSLPCDTGRLCVIGRWRPCMSDTKLKRDARPASSAPADEGTVWVDARQQFVFPTRPEREA